MKSYLQLRKALAKAYPGEGDWRAAATDLGLDTTKIELRGKSSTVWGTILATIRELGRMDGLRSFIESEEPQLLALFDAYATEIAAGVFTEDAVPDPIHQSATPLQRPADATPRWVDHAIREQPTFVGRDGEAGELKRIEDALWFKGGVALTNSVGSVTMIGLGGVGKTMLAKQYAYLNQDKYEGIAFIRCEKEETRYGDLITLGGRFIDGLSRQEKPDREKAIATSRALEDAGFDKPWLLIYDNVENSADLDDLLPRGGPHVAHVLVTTRFPHGWEGFTEVPIGAFPRAVSIKYLMKGKVRGKTEEGANRLAEAVGDLPLALAHARSYCECAHNSFDEYCDLLSKRLLEHEPRAGAKTGLYPNSVWGTFTLALDWDPQRRIPKAKPAWDVMRRLAFLAPEDVPRDLLALGRDTEAEFELTGALAALNRGSLITFGEFEDGAPRYSTHRIVQLVMRELLVEQGDLVTAAAEAVDALRRRFKLPDQVEDLPRAKLLAPHALAVLDNAPDAVFRQGDWADWVLGLFNLVIDWQASRGNRAEAIRLAERALGLWRSRDNLHSKGLHLARFRLADLRASVGNYEGALALWQESLEVCDCLRQTDVEFKLWWTREYATSLSRIADLRAAIGDRPGARLHYQQALRIKKILVEQDPEPERRQDLAVTLGRIADLEAEEGNPEKALELWVKSYELRCEIAEREPIPRRRRAVAASLGRIAEVKAELGDHNGAWEALRDSGIIWEELLAIDPTRGRWRDLAWNHFTKGVFLAQTHENAYSAANEFEAAVKIYEDLLLSDPDVPDRQADVAKSRMWLAKCGVDPKTNLDRAIALFRSLTIKGLLDEDYALRQRHLPDFPLYIEEAAVKLPASE